MPEIELKLIGTPDDLAKIEDALHGMAAGETASPSLLGSTYFDTPDLALKNREIVLRVRRQGEQFLQTVKTQEAGTTSLLERGEWEDVVATDRPDLGAAASGKHLPAVTESELHPIFTTAVRRTTVTLEPRAGTRLEAAIDRGEIRAISGDVAAPISEVELELRSGDPAVLYDVALRLLDVAPLRIELRSKAERGYALVAGDRAAIPVLHATPLALAPDMTVEAALQTVGRQCLTMLLRNEPAALSGMPDGVHQMRVAARRLRSALSAVRPMLPPEHYRWARDELKWIAAELGPARNWDVFEASLLQPVYSALSAEPALYRLSDAADSRRRAAYEQARAAVRSPRFTLAALKLLRWFEARGWRDQPVSENSARLLEAIGTVAPELVDRRYRQTRKRTRHFAALTPDQRHELRIAAKKLRYTVEFLAPLFPRRKVGRFLKRLRPLQDDLGHANDVRIAADLVGELRSAEERSGGIDRAGGIVLGWHERGVADHEPMLGRRVRRFRAADPFWR